MFGRTAGAGGRLLTGEVVRGIPFTVLREDACHGPIPKVGKRNGGVSSSTARSKHCPNSKSYQECNPRSFNIRSWLTPRSSERKPSYPAGPRRGLPPSCHTPHPRDRLCPFGSSNSSGDFGSESSQARILSSAGTY